MLSNRGALPPPPAIAILGAAPCHSWGTVQLPIGKVGGAAEQIASLVRRSSMETARERRAFYREAHEMHLPSSQRARCINGADVRL